jgi:hypothetical protein
MFAIPFSRSPTTPLFSPTSHFHPTAPNSPSWYTKAGENIMSASHRAKINRANSQHSTGPQTAAGKKKSSLNALRHGLTSQLVVMPDEDFQAYQLHIESFIGEYLPQGATEIQLAQALADTSWRMNRVAALETNLLALGAAVQPGAFANPVQDALATVASLESRSKTLANLSLHSQRLSRQFERTVALLRDLQKTRRIQDQPDLNNLLDIMEVHKAKGETYDPAADGFVFSQTQIDHGIRLRNRERRIEEVSHYHRAAA